MPSERASRSGHFSRHCLYSCWVLLCSGYAATPLLSLSGSSLPFASTVLSSSGLVLQPSSACSWLVLQPLLSYNFILDWIDSLEIVMSSFSCAGPVQLVGTLGEKRFSVVQSMQGQPCCSGRLAVDVQLFNIPGRCFARRSPIWGRMRTVSTPATTSTHTRTNGGRGVAIFKFTSQICHESRARQWPCGPTIEANSMNMTHSVGKVPGISPKCN